MNQLVTIVVAVAGAVVVTMTAPPVVAVVTVCALAFTAMLAAKVTKGL